MADKNIFLKRGVAADETGSLNKSGQASFPLRNGDIVELGACKNGIYTLTKPTATTKRYAIVYNADTATEGDYKGLSDDPRKVEFKEGTIVNLFCPRKEDDIAITVVEGTESGATHVVPVVGGVGYKFASAAGDTLAFKIKEENKFVSVGNERIKTYELVCAAE